MSRARIVVGAVEPAPRALDEAASALVGGRAGRRRIAEAPRAVAAATPATTALPTRRRGASSSPTLVARRALRRPGAGGRMTAVGTSVDRDARPRAPDGPRPLRRRRRPAGPAPCPRRAQPAGARRAVRRARGRSARAGRAWRPSSPRRTCPTFASRSASRSRRRRTPSEVLQPLLARDRVRYVGEPVAVVVAEDPWLAEDAAELVELDLDYGSESAVVDPVAAAADGAPLVHPELGSNVVDVLPIGVRRRRERVRGSRRRRPQAARRRPAHRRPAGDARARRRARPARRDA